MINLILKKMADSWFSYLQNQICKEFEFLEKGRKKFIKEIGIKKIKMKGRYIFFLSGGSVLKKLELINLLSLANLQKSLDKKY